MNVITCISIDAATRRANDAYKATGEVQYVWATHVGGAVYVGPDKPPALSVCLAVRAATASEAERLQRLELMGPDPEPTSNVRRIK
jgi:hypothetical protein